MTSRFHQIGSMAVFADFLGVLGTGIGLVLLISVIRQYFELINKNKGS